MECDYAGHTIPVIDPSTGEIRAAQIYVAVLSASQLTFSYASFSQKLPDWIEANQRAFSYFGGVTKTTICDDLRSAVAKALWFEPTINATFAAFAEHYDTTVLPARPKRPQDKSSAEGSVLIVERCVRDCQEFCARGWFRHWLTNLSPKTTANWVLASNHSRGGRFHSSAAWFSTRYSSFMAASSLGKCPRVRTGG
ncbi:hypothetical protein X743_27050 [Mesorhizobium sp. LNHC252B00]|nr:hypothetical protein X743_27050 [Mesorhizobium sp. LNHC252B00]